MYQDLRLSPTFRFGDDLVEALRVEIRESLRQPQIVTDLPCVFTAQISPFLEGERADR